MYKYTADLHLGFKDIIDKCNRPFSSVEEMNAQIVRNMNENTDTDDILVILGDVSAYKCNVVDLLKQIHCQKVLVKGNHDKEPLSHRSFRKCFLDIRNTLMTKDGEYKLFLSHYPMAEWDGYYKGYYHFYGHVHNSCEGGAGIMRFYKNAVNVGIDVNQFIPKTAKELISGRIRTYEKEREQFANLTISEFFNTP